MTISLRANFLPIGQVGVDERKNANEMIDATREIIEHRQATPLRWYCALKFIVLRN